MPKSPLSQVKDEFGGKDKLVDQLVSLLETDETKEDLRKRLLGVANGKLLRLHRIASAVKTKFGSREKLIEGAAAALGRGKDKDYVASLARYSTPRLVDMQQVAERKTKRAAAKPAAAKKPAAKAKAPAKAKAKTGKAAAKSA
jgi:hypothetical protein